MRAIARTLLTGMTGGLIALIVTLAVATAAGLLLRRYSGRFRRVQSAASSTPLSVAAPGAAPGSDLDAPASVLTGADLGTGLGERATLVQFSTTFCAPCRPTRQILTSVAAMVDGVRHVEIDATTRLDLVRRLRILTWQAMERTRVRNPEGSATTSSPGRTVPAASWPAKPRKS